MPRPQHCFALFALLLLAACGGTQTAQEPATEFAGPGLHAVRGSGFEHAYVLPGAGLDRYRVLRVDSMDTDGVEFRNTSIPGTTGQHWRMTPQRTESIQTGWASAMASAFSDFDRSGAGDRVLHIRSELTRIAGARATDSAAMSVPRSTASSGDVVEISIEIRLYDDAAGQLLAVIRDRRSIPLTVWTRGGDSALNNLFSSWAQLLHTRVSGR